MEAQNSEEETPLLTAGLHHVTFSCVHAAEHDRFWTQILGLRRVKQTVDYDCPDSYHLYYGDKTGAPGAFVSCLLLPDTIARSAPQTRQDTDKTDTGTAEKTGGEKARRIAGAHKTVFAVPKGALDFWRARLRDFGIACAEQMIFGGRHLCFRGHCGEELEITEAAAGDKRRGWAGAVSADKAICGLHSLNLAVTDPQKAAQFLQFLGYRKQAEEKARSRFVLPQGNGANIIDVEQGGASGAAGESNIKPGSMAHFAFAAAKGLDLADLREIMLDNGYMAGSMVENVYFLYFYLQMPQQKSGKILEFAANGPGFSADERADSLGSALQLPKSHEHLRSFIAARLEKLLS